MAPRGLKEKRRNSEKRKEKSRDAARCRRSKESEIFNDLAELLPISTSLSAQLDKASVMRLTIAYLKARTLLDNSVAEADDPFDSLLPKTIDGVLFALASDGDVIYTADNVNQQLGLAQFDMIGQSIFDYCHPCDHDEMREMLNLRPDGNHLRSFSLRLKSTLTAKGRSLHFKSSAYRVMSCTGRIIGPACANKAPSQESPSSPQDAEEESQESEGKHYLIMIGDPIPHPSNIETPIDEFTFLTKHSLDMKYTYVDDKIAQFLGYVSEDLEGKSAYDYHHILDNDVVLKSYKTLLAKGQIQTPCYRFLARHGGYAWVQTQASLIHGAKDARPHAVVCVHTCISEIEAKDQILTTWQCSSSSSSSSSGPEEEVIHADVIDADVIQQPKTVVMPQNITSKLFVPRTAEMVSPFLDLDDVKGIDTSQNGEPDDLTHLAPIAGDCCIPLEIPANLALCDLFDAADLSPEMLDCLPLTGFEFPVPPLTDDDVVEMNITVDARSCSAASDHHDLRPAAPASSAAAAAAAASLAASQFQFRQLQSSFSDSSSPFTPDDGCRSASASEEEEDIQHSTSAMGVSLINLNIDSSNSRKMTTFLSMDEEEELETRAPFIPMGDDLPIFDPTDILIEMDNLAWTPTHLSTCNSSGVPAQSALIKLLQHTSIIDATTADPLAPSTLKTSLINSPITSSSSSPSPSSSLSSRPSSSSNHCIQSLPEPSEECHQSFHYRGMKRYYAEATLPSTMPALKRTKSSETNVTTRPMPLLPPDPSHPSPPSQLDLEQTKTPTLLELLTLKQPRPRHPVAAPAAPAPASKTIRSVLHNLLVSGYDSKAGYTILEQVAASKDDDLLCPPTRTPPSPASPSVDPYLVNPSPPPSASDNVLTLSGLDVALLGKEVRRCDYQQKTLDEPVPFTLHPFNFDLDPDSIDCNLMDNNEFLINLELPLGFETVD